jgi:hypothetical protein
MLLRTSVSESPDFRYSQLHHLHLLQCNRPRNVPVCVAVVIKRSWTSKSGKGVQTSNFQTYQAAVAGIILIQGYGIILLDSGLGSHPHFLAARQRTCARCFKQAE